MIIRNRRGFSLIELMIVIAIIGILVAVALPQFASMTEDAKKTKAKQDCDTIVQSIQKYNSLEGVMVEELMDLKGKYLTNIDTLRDPWGNSYQLDPYGGNVYSKGPDGQTKLIDAGNGIKYIDPDAKNVKDNIKVSYIGALTIVDAKIEIDPLGESDGAWRRDVMHLYFNKKVKMITTGGELDINGMSSLAVNKPTVPHASGKTADPEATAGNVFRWSMGSKNRYTDGNNMLMLWDGSLNDGNGGMPDREDTLISYASGVCTLLAGDPTDATTYWSGQIPDSNATNVEAPASHQIDCQAGPDDAGAVYETEENMEVVIVMPSGTSGSIIPGSHYVNLTGNRKARNPYFMEFDGVTGAEMSGTPIQIQVYD